MKFRKKPVVIDAVQWDGTVRGKRLVEDLFPGINTNCISFLMTTPIDSDACCGWTFHTLEGLITASPGDYIIKGIKGEFYPCKPDIFEATYERVE